MIKLLRNTETNLLIDFNASYFFLNLDTLSRLDDPCANVRGLALECLSILEVDRSDDAFSEVSDSIIAETVINRLFLYLDDPYIKMRPILIGKIMKFELS